MNIKKSVLLFVIVAAMAIIALGFVQGGFQPTFVKNETSGYEASASEVQSELQIEPAPSVVVTPSVEQSTALATSSPTPEPPTVVETIITTAPTTLPTPEQTVVVQTTVPTPNPTTVPIKSPEKKDLKMSIIGDEVLPNPDYPGKYIHKITLGTDVGFNGGKVNLRYEYNGEEFSTTLSVPEKVLPGGTYQAKVPVGTIADSIDAPLGGTILSEREAK